MIQQTERLLIVDDEHAANDTIKSSIDRLGLPIKQAYSHEEALECISESFYDFIILDQVLGDGDGLDVLRQLRRRQYEHKPFVLIISAKDSEEFIESCFQIGADDYLSKPIRPTLLRLKIKAFLEKRRLRRTFQRNNHSLQRLLVQMEDETRMARFIYDHLRSRYHENIDSLQWHIQPHSQFSGDMVISCAGPNGHLYGMVADATGHGLAAALTMLPALGVFHAMVKKGFPLVMIIRELDRKVFEESPDDRFVAAVMFEYDPDLHELEVWNGGMPPAFWVNGGGIEHEFISTALPLGLSGEEFFDGQTQSIKTNADGFFMAISDGLVEQRDGNDNFLPVDNFRDCVAQSSADSVISGCVDMLKRHLDQPMPDDDVSLMVFKPGDFTRPASPQTIDNRLMQGNALWSYRLCGFALVVEAFLAAADEVLQRWVLSLTVKQRAFTVLSELITNAIDHGCLGLDSNLKTDPEGFAHYFEKREERMAHLSDSDWVEVRMNLTSDSLIIEVEDSGVGYRRHNSTLSNLNAVSGRGLALCRQLVSQMVVTPPGNMTMVSLSLIGSKTDEQALSYS
ncbi:fused response regulator/phosphatase [Saccharospirillum mangrovi]|uniref:fused response regulator/phosphatase n=1 Tax=Saccharospirillum mangrovi TaxID=2161747 RepID=UPI000D3BEDE7|nr:fused response regulator/phosphatase [Saccharospirillum mangrovi]